ncbi:hypothetical protein, partial [Pseudomonas sp. MWU13-2100]|uniref:hypothetical protein n=1 Tax=Pseudomonas sp. MWU13-2100 TaxID=2935075 RepID=UPI00201040C2
GLHINQVSPRIFDLASKFLGAINVLPAPKSARQGKECASRRFTPPSGLPGRVQLGYTHRLSKVHRRVLPAMEINPILNSIKDLSERSETIRGYL